MATTAPVKPRAGRHYPKNWPEFHKWFPDEEACLAYLEELRWGGGFQCPACGYDEAWKTKRGLWVCSRCQHQTSVTAGTIMQGTRLPIHSWFTAIWLLTNQKHGISAKGLQNLLGFGSYETAWAWLHKLRRAMVRPGRGMLEGRVEVDETYVGGREAGVHGRLTHTKSLVVIAVEFRKTKDGHHEYATRVRMARLPGARARKGPLMAFITDNVKRGSKVRTDGLNVYADLPTHGFKHEVINVSASGAQAHVSMPHVHRISALLKRWLLGTHQGSVQPKQLDYYLDEYCFRFNRRFSSHRGMLFYRLLQEVVATEPIPMNQIVGGQVARNTGWNPRAPLPQVAPTP